MDFANFPRKGKKFFVYYNLDFGNSISPSMEIYMYESADKLAEELRKTKYIRDFEIYLLEDPVISEEVKK